MNKILFLLLLAAGACSPMVYDHGIPNFAKVDTGIYRSGQITTLEGWKYLKQITKGKRIHIIKLNFTKEGSDQIATTLGYDVHYLPLQPEGDQDIGDDFISTMRGPDHESVLQAIVFLMSADKDDVWLVHCTHGQDRTGFVIGAFRVLAEGWNKDKAYKEMLDHHFHWELYGLKTAWDGLQSW